MEQKARDIAKKFIQFYFVYKDDASMFSLLSDEATWSGFPGDSKVYSYEQARKKIRLLMKRKGESRLLLVKEVYKLLSYHNTTYVIECRVEGKVENTDLLIKRRICLTIELNGEQGIISSVQILPILDQSDVMYVDHLKEQSEQLKIVRSILNFGMLTCCEDEYFTIISMDDNLCRILGYTNDELLDTCHGKAGELIFSEDYEQTIKNIQKQFSCGSEYSCKYRVRKKDGSLIWVWDSGMRVMEDDGRTVIRALLADINDLENLRKERDTAFENIPGGVSYIDIFEDDFVVREANDNFFKMFEISNREEYLSQNIRYTYPEDLQNLREHLCSNAKLKQPVDIEFRISHPVTGEIKWYRMVGKFYSQGKDFAEYFCIMLDITRRQEAINALSREKEHYWAAMRNTADVFFEYDVEKDEMTFYPRVLDGEQGVETWRGTRKDWRTFLFDNALIHPEDGRKMERLIDQVISGSVEVRVLSTRDNKRRQNYQWYKIQTSGIDNQEGKIVQIVGVFQNIEKQKRLAAAGEELKQIFDVQLSNNYERILKIDLNTEEYKLFTNDSGQFYGHSQTGSYERAIQRMREQFVYKEEREHYLYTMNTNHMQEVLNTGEGEVTRYFRILSPNGEYRWKSYRYTYFGMDIDTILITVQDVHDIRMEEQKQEEANRRILVDALEEAKKANQARKNFVAMATNEVKNPVQVIYEMSKMSWEDTENPEKVREHMMAISEAASYVLNITNDMTQIEQLEMGKMRFEHEKVELATLILELIEQQRSIANRNQIRIVDTVHMATDREYYCDSFRIRQVIENVVANAIRFSSEGMDVCVDVTEQEIKPGKSNLVVLVEDRGLHIDTEYFERSYCEDVRSVFSQGGMLSENTGFSLLLCKELVELMGGTVEVRYGNLEENYMRLEIPIDYQQIGEQPLQLQSNEKAEPIPTVDLSSYSILLVENEQKRNRLLGPLLKVNGAKVDLATSAREALSLWNIYTEGSFQAILVDKDIPDMDYGEFATIIRQSEHEDAKSVPIIVMTDNATEDMKRGYQKGVNSSISKPIDMKRLAQILEAVNYGVIKK